MKTRLYIGDAHGQHGRFNKVVVAALDAFSGTVDEIVQVGDFGFWPNCLPVGLVYHRSGFDVPVRWIDGNHEDFRTLATDPNPEDWDCTHIPRGTFEDGVFFMGGGTSHDRTGRVPGDSDYGWFPDENISQRDFYAAMDTVEEHREAISVMCCHDTVQFAYHRLSGNGNKPRVSDPNAEALEALFNVVRPLVYIHGHHHHSDRYEIDDTFFVSLDRCDHRSGSDFRKCTVVVRDDGTILDW